MARPFECAAGAGPTLGAHRASGGRSPLVSCRGRPPTMTVGGRLRRAARTPAAGTAPSHWRDRPAARPGRYLMRRSVKVAAATERSRSCCRWRPCRRPRRWRLHIDVETSFITPEISGGPFDGHRPGRRRRPNLPERRDDRRLREARGLSVARRLRQPRDREGVHLRRRDPGVSGQAGGAARCPRRPLLLGRHEGHGRLRPAPRGRQGLRCGSAGRLRDPRRVRRVRGQSWLIGSMVTGGPAPSGPTGNWVASGGRGLRPQLAAPSHSSRRCAARPYHRISGARTTVPSCAASENSVGSRLGTTSQPSARPR